MDFRELGRLPNLLSLSRIPLSFAVWYFVRFEDSTSIIIAASLLTLAGMTDGLDGYFARRQGQITKLGIALDPIADKFFAIILVFALIVHRDFPVWLATAVVGRDLLILIGGLFLSKDKRVSLPSNMTGKYAFGMISVLIASYVIQYPFGIAIVTPIVVVLLAASTIGYARVFYLVSHDRPVPPYEETSIRRVLRLGFLYGFSVVYLVKLYLDLLR